MCDDIKNDTMCHQNQTEMITELPIGFPTHTKDITGETICMGDTVGYDFDDSTSTFTVVFEDNAFRKQYKDWDETLPKPFLESDKCAKNMRLKIIQPASEWNPNSNQIEP